MSQITGTSDLLITKATGSGTSSCTFTNVTRTQNNVLAYPTSDVKQPVVKGDKIHATPYYREVLGFNERGRDNSSGEVTGAFMAIENFNGRGALGCINSGSPWNERITGDVWAGLLIGTLNTPSTTPDPDRMSRTKGLAVTKALANVNKSANNVPLLIAERRQTLNMIRSRIGQLTAEVGRAQKDGLARYLKARKADRKQVAKDVASLHLEYLFGWLPLVDEVQAAIARLAKPQKMEIRGRGRERFTVNSEVEVEIPNKTVVIEKTQVRVPIKRTTGATSVYSARASFLYEINLESASGAISYGFNPAAVAFDLVPASFVLGYCSNVSSWLKSFDPAYGCSYVTGSVSTWFEDIRFVQVNGHEQVSATSKSKSVGSAKIQRRGFETRREAFNNGPPTPTLYLEDNFSLGKLASTISMVIQQRIKPVEKLVKQREFRYRGKRPRWLPPIKYTK